MKVDLTKYIEQHSFTFDDVFDSDDTNEKVTEKKKKKVWQGFILMSFV